MNIVNSYKKNALKMGGTVKITKCIKSFTVNRIGQELKVLTKCDQYDCYYRTEDKAYTLYYKDKQQEICGCLHEFNVIPGRD